MYRYCMGLMAEGSLFAVNVAADDSDVQTHMFVDVCIPEGRCSSCEVANTEWLSWRSVDKNL